MSQTITFTIDGTEIEAKPGQTIIEAADAAGVYIPRLCHKPELVPHGSCRVCTVMVNGRPQAACTTPVAPGMIVENETEKVTKHRKNIIEMLFVEGNHYCMFCEKSGNCELQALAYRFGVLAPKFKYQFPDREVDASHPEVLLDKNRCIKCGRCIRASIQEGKHEFDFTNRGLHREITANASTGFKDTDLKATDKAAEACPVGCIIKKRTGYAVPVGERLFDHKPIGSEIEGSDKS